MIYSPNRMGVVCGVILALLASTGFVGAPPAYAQAGSNRYTRGVQAAEDPSQEAAAERAKYQQQVAPLMQSNPVSDQFKLGSIGGFELKDASEGILILEKMLKLREHPQLKWILYLSVLWLLFYWWAKWMILKRLTGWPSRLVVRACAFCVNLAMLSVLIPYAVLGPSYLEASVKSIDYAWRMLEKTRK